MTGFVLLGGLLAVGFTCLRLQARAFTRDATRPPVRASDVCDHMEATRERTAWDPDPELLPTVWDFWEDDLQAGSGL